MALEVAEEDMEAEVVEEEADVPNIEKLYECPQGGGGYGGSGG